MKDLVNGQKAPKAVSGSVETSSCKLSVKARHCRFKTHKMQIGQHEINNQVTRVNGGEETGADVLVTRWPFSGLFQKNKTLSRPKIRSNGGRDVYTETKTYSTYFQFQLHTGHLKNNLHMSMTETMQNLSIGFSNLISTISL